MMIALPNMVFLLTDNRYKRIFTVMEKENRFINNPRLSLFFFLVLIGCTNFSDDDCFVIEPYVVHVENDSAQLLWVTPASTDAGTVMLTAVDSDQEQRVTAQVSTPLFQDSRLDEGTLNHLRHLALIENLESFTQYQYEVQCGDGKTSSTGKFLTAPEPDDPVPFEFVIVSDGHAYWRYSRISEPVARSNPAFVIHNGDFTSGRGDDWDRWKIYFDVARPYLESSVLVPVVGAHDVLPARNFRSLFAFNDPFSNSEKEDDAATYYHKQYGNLLILVLDHVYDLDEQIRWVESVLSENESKWKVVSIHEPMLRVGGRGQLLPGHYYELAKIFEEYGVDLVIGGHDHIYERKLPLGGAGKKPVHYITINSNGNHREIRPSPIIFDGIGQQVHMYAHFSVDGNVLRMEAVKFDGTIIDTLELIKNENGMYQDHIMESAIDLDQALKLAHIYTGQDPGDEMRYLRRDITGELLTPIPKGGERATVRLNTGNTIDKEAGYSNFPPGSQLVIYEQNNPDNWVTEKQILEINGRNVDVETTAPVNISFDEKNGFNIPVNFHVNVIVDGRKYEQVIILPTLFDHPVEEETGLTDILKDKLRPFLEDNPKIYHRLKKLRDFISN